MRIGIIGAGIIGLSCARECRKIFPNAEIIVFEKNAAAFSENSIHNSGVVHSGIHQKLGSLRSSFAHTGSKLLTDYCQQNEILCKPTAMLIAIAPADMPSLIREASILFRLWENSRRQRIRPPKVVFKKDIYALEPNISAICGLLLSGIWVIDQKSLGTQLVREMEGIGVDIRLRTEIKSISFNGEYAVFGTDTAEESVTHVINSAGLHADIIARMAGFDAPEISPVRGEYYEVFSDKKNLIHSHLIYPALPPGHPVKGIHFTKTADGRLLIGPNATAWDRREDDASDQSPKKEFVDAVKKFLPSLTPEDIQWAYSGIRPKIGGSAEEHDFIVRREQSRIPFVNLIGIESPGFTASFALAEYAEIGRAHV